jgi:RNA polymerase sigma factor (sigma-70 family)
MPPLPAGPDPPTPAQHLLDPEVRALVRRAARRIAWSADAAQDVADLEQELLARTLVRLDRFDPRRGRLGPFAGRVVRRLAQNLARDRRAARQKAGPVASLDAIRGVLREVALVGDRRTGRSTDPALLELALDIAGVLDTLEAEDQALLRDVPAVGQADAARAAGVDRARVRKALDRARSALRAKGWVRDE